MTGTTHPTVHRAAIWAAAADIVWVLVFAGIGRHSHDEHEGVAQVLATAWPFLAGTAVGWLAVRVWRRPLSLWPAGAAVWAATWAVGMLLRLLTGQGIAPSFQVVAAVFLGIGLMGWRAVVALVARRREARA